MTFRCPTCLVDTADLFCDVCGRHLTAKDLTVSERRPRPSLEGMAAGGRQEEH